MYSPIIGASEEYSGYEPSETPTAVMERTAKLHTAYDDLRTDLLEESTTIDKRMIRPAQEAKDCIQPMKKVIKKRGDKKVENPTQIPTISVLIFAAGLREISI